MQNINSYKQLTEKILSSLNQQQERIEQMIGFHHPFFRTVVNFEDSHKNL